MHESPGAQGLEAPEDLEDPEDPVAPEDPEVPEVSALAGSPREDEVDRVEDGDANGDPGGDAGDHRASRDGIAEAEVAGREGVDRGEEGVAAEEEEEDPLEGADLDEACRIPPPPDFTVSKQISYWKTYHGAAYVTGKINSYFQIKCLTTNI